MNFPLRIIHANGFSPAELLERRAVVYSNILHAMQAIIGAMDAFGLNYANVDRKAGFHLVRGSNPFQMQSDAKLVTITIEAQRDSQPFSSEL